MSTFEAILLTVITASTPLLLAAIGELLTERSGVLNLGVEGMMGVGAATAFGVAVATDNGALGVLGGIIAGLILSMLFAFLTVILATNQVATGLALTLLGLGVANAIGGGLVGIARDPLPKLDLPGLTDIPFFGSLLFGHDALVYLSIGLVFMTWFCLTRTRLGLTIRSVGDNHTSAHALGIKVVAVRFGCVAFGGACAGLAGAYLSLSYTPLWVDGMTAGRGWIALALVVFASWMPWRVLIGAYLFGAVTILQFHAQGAGIQVPSQLLSALPYIATIVVLVLISRDAIRTRANTPACLGRPFVSDR